MKKSSRRLSEERELGPGCLLGPPAIKLLVAIKLLGGAGVTVRPPEPGCGAARAPSLGVVPAGARGHHEVHHRPVAVAEGLGRRALRKGRGQPSPEGGKGRVSGLTACRQQVSKLLSQPPPPSTPFSVPRAPRVGGISQQPFSRIIHPFTKKKSPPLDDSERVDGGYASRVFFGIAQGGNPSPSKQEGPG